MDSVLESSLLNRQSHLANQENDAAKMNLQNMTASSMQLISFGKEKGDFNRSSILVQESNYKAKTPEKVSHQHQFSYSHQKDVRKD